MQMMGVYLFLSLGSVKAIFILLMCPAPYLSLLVYSSTLRLNLLYITYFKYMGYLILINFIIPKNFSYSAPEVAFL